MTDKQIIIDGIDVSGCEDYGYRGKAGYWCHNYDEPCTDYPNCNYKQLKRKEEECETLASQLDFEVQKKECLEQKCEELKQTLIEIKDILEISEVENAL